MVNTVMWKASRPWNMASLIELFAAHVQQYEILAPVGNSVIYIPTIGFKLEQRFKMRQGKCAVCGGRSRYG
jgi:hypothetical protein